MATESHKKMCTLIDESTNIINELTKIRGDLKKLKNINNEIYSDFFRDVEGGMTLCLVELTRIIEKHLKTSWTYRHPEGE